MSCIVEIQKSIDYIEKNIIEDINFEIIAKQIGMSSYYFHRMFKYIVGITPTEYIRNRRLSLSAEELCYSKANILDIAIKYQFESNESFTRAFTKFHNVTPKMAKLNGTNLKKFSPIQLKFEINGGNVLDYRIEEKEEFQICAIFKDFMIENKNEIPSFWNEFKSNGILNTINKNETKKVVGVCVGKPNSEKYQYGIGRILSPNDNGFKKGKIVNIQKSSWAVFECKSQKAEDINILWTRIYKEFFVSSGYKQSMDIDFELYDNKNTEIWIPITKY